MPQTVLENARLFDGFSADCREGVCVLIEDERIREVSDRPIAAADARRINVAGKTLMPGLIDLHVHAYASSVNLQKVNISGSPYNTAHAMRMLGHAVNCGFTTVRDIGGGDWSLAQAVRENLFLAPRFFYAGKILSMTGGHADYRGMHEGQHEHGMCACSVVNSLAVIADGADECLKAVREELRKGAHCIKILGSGGVASPLDPIWMNQYRDDEIRTIVNECTERRTYVSSHCHPTDAVRRSLEAGVRVIEHGTLMDADTARFVVEQGGYVVPTMAVIWALSERGPGLGFPEASLRKLEEVFGHALEGMDHMRSAGVKIGFGSDLLGETYNEQCREFLHRRQVFEPIEILRQATSMAAEILMHEGQLGCVAAGAYADLLVVDGDPLSDIGLLAQNGERLDLIVRNGDILKNRL